MAGLSEDGLSAAVASIDAGEGEIFSPPAHQLSLLPAEAVADLPTAAADRQTAYRDRSRQGRQPGAKNRATQEWRDFILSRYTSPLQFLAEIFCRPVHVLAEEIGATRAEALAVQVRAASELAPYLHGKAPVEIKAEGGLPMMLMVSPDQALSIYQAGGQAAPPAFDLAMVERVENQEVSGAGGCAVGQSELDSDAKALADQALASSEPLISDQPGRASDQPASASPDHALAADPASPGHPPPILSASSPPHCKMGPPDFPGQPIHANGSSIQPEGEGKGEPGSAAYAPEQSREGRG